MSKMTIGEVKNIDIHVRHDCSIFLFEKVNLFLDLLEQKNLTAFLWDLIGINLIFKVIPMKRFLIEFLIQFIISVVQYFLDHLLL